MKTKDIILCALFAAVLCILSVITIPIGIIPVTLGILGVLLVGVILGWRKGLISTLVFILLGCVGLPVFSGLQGGFQVLAGPTGGYITGYIGTVLLVGAASDKIEAAKRRPAALYRWIACMAGVFVCYLFGTIQYMLISQKSVWQALALCVYPFIPLDILKCIAAASVGGVVRSHLQKVTNA